MEGVLEDAFLEEGVEITDELFAVDASVRRMQRVCNVRLQHAHGLLNVRLQADDRL